MLALYYRCMSGLSSERIPIIAENVPGSRLLGGFLVARFMWPEGPAKDTYTVAPSPETSLELDAHIPVRPQTLRVFHEASRAENSILEVLVGANVAAALQETRGVGSTTIFAALTEMNRFAIASLQAESPSTPPRLRELCTVMAATHNEYANLIPSIANTNNSARTPYAHLDTQPARM